MNPGDERHPILLWPLRRLFLWSHHPQGSNLVLGIEQRALECMGWTLWLPVLSGHVSAVKYLWRMRLKLSPSACNHWKRGWEKPQNLLGCRQMNGLSSSSGSTKCHMLPRRRSWPVVAVAVVKVWYRCGIAYVFASALSQLTRSLLWQQCKFNFTLTF